MNCRDMHKYDYIIDLPHHVSKTHPQMPLSDRAFQFAPFAALTGHHEAVRETARLTDERAELNEDILAALDMQLKYLEKHLDERPDILLTYFTPDSKKKGGSYTTAAGQVKRIDEYKRAVVLTDGTHIPIYDIVDIEYIQMENLKFLTE